MLQIVYSSQAISFLKKADIQLAKRILKKIEQLQEDPVGHEVKRIVGSELLFRVRIGQYRVLYEVDYQGNLIGIIKIDKRSRIYK